MSDSEIIKKYTPHFVATGYDKDGKPIFITDQKRVSAAYDVSGVVWLWETDGIPVIPANIGAFPDTIQFPGPGGTKFGICWMAPESQGKMDYGKGDVAKSGSFKARADPSFHATASMEYAIVLSGEVDLELEGGQSMTLRKGSCWVQTGAPHAWHVRGTEPCVFALFVIGAVVQAT